MPHRTPALWLAFSLLVATGQSANASANLAAAPAASLTSAAVSTTPDKSTSPWTPIRSDLPVDPLLRDGTLRNGLRYLILPNAEPKDHVSLRLVVGVGSLEENDDERGLAHFVEHMAFRGTREHPDGSATTDLQRLGIALGPDSTAFTTYDHTIYHLELADTKESTLRTALGIFREYSDSVTFDPALIERERGVILSEMATRDTPDARTADANYWDLWPNSRAARRKVIGDADQIRHFTRDQFVAFYDAWYRPERIAVIVVGAVDSAATEKLIAATFGNMKARARARPEPADLVATECGPATVDAYCESDIPGMGITLEKAVPQLGETTHSDRVRILRRNLAFTMLQNRLRKLANAPSCPYVSPYVAVNRGIRGWTISTLSVSGRIKDWRAVATDIEQEHRRALLYGFTAAEFATAQREYATALDEAVRSAATRRSNYLAQDLVSTLLYGETFATPTAVQQDLARDLASTTASDCLKEFRAAWLPGGTTVYINANSAFAVTVQQLAATLNASRAQPVTAPTETPVPEFAYKNFGPPGKVADEEHLDDLDVTLSRFRNGVRVNFKPTPFVADTVDVRVRVGTGKLSQRLSQPGLDLLAEYALLPGGVGRHTDAELGEILAGHTVSLTFGPASDALVFDGRCAARELDLLLRVICAYLTDASFRPEAQRAAESKFVSVYTELAATAGGEITAAAPRDMFNDFRFGIAPLREMDRRTLDEVVAWIGPQLKGGPIEVSIVGDTSWPAVKTAVAATLGALPKRPGPEKANKLEQPVHVSLPPPKPNLVRVDPNLKQIAIVWYWPIPDPVDIHLERRLNVLASVVAERARVKLRSELGATYDPWCYFYRTDGFPNANYLEIYAEVDPAAASRAFEIFEREIDALRRSGPTADEFERVREPYLRSMNDDLLTNAYWCRTVLADAQQRPDRIAAARDRAKDIVTINRAEIATLAERYLDSHEAFKYLGVPSSRR